MKFPAITERGSCLPPIADLIKGSQVFLERDIKIIKKEQSYMHCFATDKND